MARTKQEIIESIKTDFVANPTLQQLYGLTVGKTFDEEFSLVSLESQLIEVFGISSKTIEDLLDMHLQEVTFQVSEFTPGTLGWYRQQAFAFQFGDSLTWNPQKLKYEYLTIDETKKIIKLCAVVEANNQLVLKVATLDTSNAPVPLTQIELDAFIFYMEQLKYAGVFIQYVSRPPDLLRLNLKVYYNPLVLSSNGALLSDSNVYPVSDAVRQYLQLTPFNGIFNVTDLIDHLQKVQGVVNPLFELADVKYGLNPWVHIVDYYQPDSGYMALDTLTVQYISV